MSRRPVTIILLKASPRTWAARGNRSASSCATVDLPEAIMPVSKKTACGRSIVLGSLAISGSHRAKPE